VRTLALALVIVPSLLSTARAQVAYRDLRALDAGPALVTTAWREERGQRRATIAVERGAARATLHEGATVRTAVASSGDVILVTAFHGGDRAFARAFTAELRGGAWSVRPPVDLARDPDAVRRGLRPAAAIASPSPGGFTIVLQEQDAGSPDADVVTTMSRVALDGTLAAAPHAIAVPWALAALAWNGRGYHLAVLYGGGGAPGTACICLVTLSEAGAPEQHPWWASPFDAVGDVQLVARADGAVELVWREGDGRAIAAATWSTVGHWGQAPPPPRRVATLEPGEAFAAVHRGGELRLATLASP
jgi:hypothetical protein